MTTLEKNIRDLIYFYAKENYNEYLKLEKLESIPDEKITDVVKSLYTDRKDHLQKFIKESLKTLLKEEHPGDLVVNNLLIEVFRDDEYCVNRITMEIKMYQQQLLNGKVNYTDIL
tara:strand:+ start:169 stop:513 length:345 start_codon:yes stop_codon:yes gene_type:complete